MPRCDRCHETRLKNPSRDRICPRVFSSHPSRLNPPLCELCGSCLLRSLQEHGVISLSGPPQTFPLTIDGREPPTGKISILSHQGTEELDKSWFGVQLHNTILMADPSAPIALYHIHTRARLGDNDEIPDHHICSDFSWQNFLVEKNRMCQNTLNVAREGYVLDENDERVVHTVCVGYHKYKMAYYQVCGNMNTRHAHRAGWMPMALSNLAIDTSDTVCMFALLVPSHQQFPPSPTTRCRDRKFSRSNSSVDTPSRFDPNETRFELSKLTVSTAPSMTFVSTPLPDLSSNP